MKNDPTGPTAEGLPSPGRRQAIKSLAGGAIVGLTGAAIIATTSCAPTEAPAAAADPLLALISKYRTQLAAFNASALDMTNEENDALAASTMDGPWQRLRDDCPTPTTMEGAIEGVRLVTDELCGGYGGIEHGVLAAVVAFFDERAAS